MLSIFFQSVNSDKFGVADIVSKNLFTLSTAIKIKILGFRLLIKLRDLEGLADKIKKDCTYLRLKYRMQITLNK